MTHPLRHFRQWLAIRRLNKLVTKQRQSFDCEQFRRRRAAALKSGRVVTLGSHQRCVGKSQVHLTPKWLIDALGPFDLDPCASDPRPWNCARTNYAEAVDGLSREWRGLVWLNPPFDRYEVGTWISRLARHGNGICLTHARTEAAWFRPIWDHADCIFFPDKRLKFCRPDGSEQSANSGAPPVLAAFGAKATLRLTMSSLSGVHVHRFMGIERA